MNPVQDKDKTYMRISGITASSTPVIKRHKPQEQSANICPRCEIEVGPLDPSFCCSTCGARYCLKCTKIPLTLYHEIEDNDIQGFSWHCLGCKISLPTLKSMDRTLKEMDTKHEQRLECLENKLDKLDLVITDKVSKQVKLLKDEVVEEIGTDIDKVIDRKIKEYEDQQLRASNIILYNMPEIMDPSPEFRRTKDTENFKKLASDIEVSEVTIKAAFRLGNMKEGKIRPLKIVIDNKLHRKKLLENAKHIQTKSKEYKKVIIARDLTPKQQEESKKLRAELHARRDAGEIVTIRQGKVVKLQQRPQFQRNEGKNKKTQNEQSQIHIERGNDHRSQPSSGFESPNMDISCIVNNDETVIGGILTGANGAGMPHF